MREVQALRKSCRTIHQTPHGTHNTWYLITSHHAITRGTLSRKRNVVRRSGGVVFVGPSVDKLAVTINCDHVHYTALRELIGRLKRYERAASPALRTQGTHTTPDDIITSGIWYIIHAWYCRTAVRQAVGGEIQVTRLLFFLSARYRLADTAKRLRTVRGRTDAVMLFLACGRCFTATRYFLLLLLCCCLGCTAAWRSFGSV